MAPLTFQSLEVPYCYVEGVETMEPNKNLTSASSGSSAASRRLGGWSGLAVCTLAIVGAILVFGGALGGTQDAGKWLPLLFVLPCAIMMFMCMKNMGGNQDQAGGSNPKTGVKPAPMMDDDHS